MKEYQLFSQNQDMPIGFYEGFDKQAIKGQILETLGSDPTDTIELTKEFNSDDHRRFYGQEIIDFYTCNPKTGKPSKIILKGDKEYYKPLTETPLPF